jgi:hypothetical protein
VPYIDDGKRKEERGKRKEERTSTDEISVKDRKIFMA